jgi:alkylation response protein AidB-like acyl-CoA dehydrogenase
MNFDLTDDQVALRDGIRSLLEGRFPMERVRDGFDRAAFDELAEAGVFSLRADGFSWADAVIVYEELGRACVPGPLVDSFGASVITGVVEPHAGRTTWVEHLATLDRLLVFTAEGVRAVDPASLAGAPAEWPLDPLTPVTPIEALPEGEVVGGPDEARRWWQEGALLTAALQVGLAASLVDQSVAYARDREQFGRAIGAFQAVKHLCAEMAVRAEVARAAVQAAACVFEDPSTGDPVRAVSGAKVLAGDAAIMNGRVATQVHGGMGFTWEVDVHLYLKRAWVLDTRFGSVDAHADAVAATLPAAR